MHRIRHFTPAIVLSLFPGLAASTLAVAGGGQIPIHQVPTTISAPGSYYLSRDLSGSPSQAMITIAASDVTIDLAGHTVEHQASTYPVIGSSGAPDNIEIFGGRIVGGLHGIHLFNVAGPTFDVRLHELTIADAFDSGILVEGGFEVAVPSEVTVTDVMVGDVGGHGIRLYAVDAGRITRNTIRDAGGSGIHVDNSHGVFVGRNTSASNTGNGVLIESSEATAVEGNLLVRNGAYALVFRNIPGQDDTGCYANNRMFGNSLGERDLQNASSYAIEPCL